MMAAKRPRHDSGRPAPPTCGYAGCRKLVFTDLRTGIAHGYCGRTHAAAALGGEVAPPHGSCHTCKLPGCDQPVFYDAETKRAHDFCSRSHATSAIENGAWTTPAVRGRGGGGARAVGSGGKSCALFGCNRPVWEDPTSTIQVRGTPPPPPSPAL